MSTKPETATPGVGSSGELHGLVAEWREREDFYRRAGDDFAAKGDAEAAMRCGARQLTYEKCADMLADALKAV